MNPYRRRGGTGLFLVLYLIFGAYFINYSLGFIQMPAVVTSINKWIFLIGGILIVIGPVNHYRLNRYRNPF